MAEYVEVKCKRCKEPFMARVADRKRGWGKYCSKSCKAIRQAYGSDSFRPTKKNGDLLNLIDRKIKRISVDQ